MRIILISIGLLNVGLGILGAILPGMPATVFLLAAAWCFARSSPRLHRWLHQHPRLGPYLHMVKSRSMPLRARIVTILLMWTGIGSSILLKQDAQAWFAPTLVVAGLIGTGFVASMRRKPVEVRPQPAGPILR